MGTHSKNINEIVSIIIVTYNNKNHIKSCISSIETNKYPHEIIVVDSASSDGTPDLVKETFPNVKILRCKENLGYGSCNNLGVKNSNGSYIAILNPDTIVKESWLKELIKPLSAELRVITTPKILVYNGSAINTCGCICHFTGLTFTRGLGAEPNSFLQQEEVSGFSGCCFALKKCDYLSLGGFDENFFLYNEDSDLSWKAHLNGFMILFIPTSVIMHDYRLNVQPEKLYYLERGRYLILRKYTKFNIFLLFLPSLFIAEVLTFGYSSKLGLKGIKFKINAILDGLTMEIDKEAGDKSILYKSLVSTIPTDQLTNNRFEESIKKLANYIFSLNLRIIR
jgi:GT2 family glycosyltransferase